MDALRVEPTKAATDYLINYICSEGYDFINEKFISFLAGKNKLKYQPEVRGVINESFLEDFPSYEMKVFPENSKELDNNDRIYFQNLKISLTGLNGKSTQIILTLKTKQLNSYLANSFLIYQKVMASSWKVTQNGIVEIFSYIHIAY